MDADTLLQQTVDRLRRHEGKYAEISRQCPEIGYSWLTKVAHGQIKNPTVSSLQQLIEALDTFEGKPQACVAEQPVPPADQAGEGADVDPDSDRIIPVEAA